MFLHVSSVVGEFKSIENIKEIKMKKILFFAVLTLLFVACNNKNKYSIKGELGSNVWDGRQVTLLGVSEQTGMRSLDSAIIEKGTFKLKGKVDTTGWYVLRIKNNGQDLYKDFYIEGKLKFFVINGQIRIIGSPINDKYQAYKDQYMALTTTIIKLNSALKADPKNKELKQSFNNEYDRFNKSFRELSLKTIKENMTNPIGLHVFQTALSSLENEEIESVLKIADPKFLAEPFVKMVIAQLDRLKKVSIGNKFKDLSMATPEGKQTMLSEYAGKGTYLLIDFWASWCGPCMQELPNVIACYKKYHGMGFDVVGVSLDDDSNAWKKAIKTHQIPWPQMSDLAGWQSSAVAIYSFSGIPHTVLLNPKGIIIANDLRGNALDTKLAELLDK